MVGKQIQNSNIKNPFVIFKEMLSNKQMFKVLIAYQWVSFTTTFVI